MKSSIEKFEIKSKKDTTRMKPIQDLQKCQLFIDNIDVRIISTFNAEEKAELLQLVEHCQDSLTNIASIITTSEAK